jgi:hypothetical protein
MFSFAEINSWAPYAAPLIGLAVSLFAMLGLFLATKAEIRRERGKSEKNHGAREADCLALWNELEAVKNEMRILPLTLAARHPDTESPVARRAQILRLHQAGVLPGQIVNALGAPLQEIELVIKSVHSEPQALIS